MRAPIAASHPVRLPQQLELVPVEIIKVLPSAGGADSACTGEGRDGMKYNVKTLSKSPNCPGAEWFCHHLAEAVGIACAHPTILSVPGEAAPAYGSRWELGMLDQGRNNEVLTARLPGWRLAERFPALYAFDLFVHNVDRHNQNFIFVQIDGAYRVVAVDFSRAWTYHTLPLPPPPVDAGQATRAWGRFVRSHFPFGIAEAIDVLDRLEKIGINTVQGIFNHMPLEWLDDIKRATISRWWTDGSLTARIAALRKGLSDGTYL